MNDITGCVSHDELNDMLHGLLSSKRSAAIESHLDCCDDCLRAANDIKVNSRLLSTLKSEPNEVRAVEPRLQSLITQLVGLHVSTQTAPWLAGPPEDDEFPVADLRLGNFRIMEQLGAGGMGVVYKAEDTTLHRMVALKVLRPRIARDAASRDHFLREAQALASIKHDHVVVVYEVDLAHTSSSDETIPVLVMELLEGQSLDVWMKEHRRPPLPWVVRLGRQIAEALAALHARGLVHRDVKPANLWLEGVTAHATDTSTSPIGRVKLLDFGIAFNVGDELNEARIPGTPAYMAPEQLNGEALDGRCDLFSLGCVLYELCTGEYPFPDRDFSSVHTPPFSACDICLKVPLELSQLIDQMLQEDRELRPDSARSLVSKLAALEKNLSDTDHRSPENASSRPSRGPRWPAAVAAIVLAILALTLLVFTPEAQKPPPGQAAEQTAAQPSPSGKGAGGEAAVAAPIQPPGDAKPVDPPAPAPALTEANDSLADWYKSVRDQPVKRHFGLVVRKLEDLNSGYSGKLAGGKVEPELVLRFTAITDDITDIRPIRALTGLKALHLIGSNLGGKLTDLTPLRGMDLANLKLGGNPDLEDLSPLKGMPLVSLDLRNTGVSSLADIAQAPLDRLYIAGSKVKDLSPLKHMSKLNYLDCRNCDIDSIEPLAHTSITQIHIDFRPERDTTVLKNLTTLRKINDTNISAFWEK